MKWLEMIKLQTATDFEREASDKIAELARDVLNSRESSGLREITFYNHAFIPGCFAMQLAWDTEIPKIHGSLLGLRLTQTMKSLGLVDHSLWMEVQKKSTAGSTTTKPACK